ncbi:hypothetical protein CN978_24750 [Priestia megaterium]|uniref:Uncharacterized protein n=1 Tax=Priestia megaterium TaxID=1404 RepID=A0AAE5UCF0_PRIMG|nr:hypothetical protein CN497_09820 [Priestia megaterium]PFJ39409.1 hypothetical protein COJ00_27920 [Priestia megaterium]PGN62439.1 hypothetical protein CN978_24750 [Priestia megaterium]
MRCNKIYLCLLLPFSVLYLLIEKVLVCLSYDIGSIIENIMLTKVVYHIQLKIEKNYPTRVR